MSDRVMRPTQPNERLFHVDALRGVAIFGILVVNMMYFAWPFYYELADIEIWSGTGNTIAQAVIWFFAESNFITMFSLLFGFGFFMLIRRAEARGQNVRSLFARRLLVLLGIGLVHTLFFWVHDVLVYFALVGFLLMLFRNKAPRSLTKWAVASLTVPILFLLVSGGLGALARTSPEGAAEMQAALGEQRELFTAMYDQAFDVYRSGSFAEITMQRTTDFVVEFVGGFLASSLFLIFAMFLTGLQFGKRGMLSDPDAHVETWKSILRWGMIVGVPTSALFTYTGFIGSSIDLGWAGMLHGTLVYVAGPALCLAYVAAIVLACRRERVRRLLAPVAAVGRNALSNYLLQSVVCTTIFYGYGFGLFGTIGPATGLFLTIGIYAVQMIISTYYIRHFRYGPAELVWRKLTYRTV